MEIINWFSILRNIWIPVHNRLILTVTFYYLSLLIISYFGLSALEKHYQPKNYHDYFYCMLYLMVVITLMKWIMTGGPYLLGNTWTFALLTVWCKRYPAEKIRFMFGFIVKSKIFLS